MLEASGLSILREQRRILSDITFALPQGSRVLVQGANGSGKSTLLLGLVGSLETVGHLSLAGEPATGQPTWARVRRGLSYLPQRGGLFPSMTVAEHFKLLRVPLEQTRRYRELANVPLDRLAGALSGGELRKIGVCLALAGRPSIVMLDEPLAGLSPPSALMVRTLLEDACRNWNPTMLIVEHEHSFAFDFVTRIWSLDNGRLTEENAGDTSGSGTS